MKDKDSGDGRRMTGGIRGNGGKQTNAGRKEKFSEGREREDRRAFGGRRESIDTECRYTLLKMRILAFLHTSPIIHLIKLQ